MAGVAGGLPVFGRSCKETGNRNNDKSSDSSPDHKLRRVESAMCANRTPTRAEVTGWSPAQLAGYLKKMNLTGCDAVVIKNGISGSRFVDLTENDLQKFPKLHAPLICKFSAEISRKEERRRFFTKKSPSPKFPDPAENIGGWADDEFDDVGNSSDENDYVEPNSSDENDYVDPNDDDGGDPYEEPPSEREDMNHLRPSDVKMSNSDYIDNRDHHPSARPPELLPRPMPSTLPKMSRRDPSPHVLSQLPDLGQPPKPQIFRNKKPGRDPGAGPPPFPGAGHRGSEQRSSAIRPPIEPPAPRPQPKPWTPAGRYEEDGRKMDDASKRRTFPLTPPRPTDLMSLGNSLPTGAKPPIPLPIPSEPPTRASKPPQDLDPRWYAGSVSRDLAEGRLRELNKDGAYLVRDSTKQLAGQPFTLMVLYHNKVYNIQIRVQSHMYQLGTGLKVQETFPTVSDIIHHYSQTPLLLIDAKNRGVSQQNQCLLSHPAGYHAASLMGRTHQ